MKELREAVVTAQRELRAIANKGIALVKPLGLISGVVSCVSEGGEAPVLMAKAACEAIVDCARTADNADNADNADLADLAAELRRIGDKLSPVVARLFGERL